uniref:EF-hand domain-containing protein n=1 Tax=Clastoptera arizonana TaxID=38151 RepID=A0A1B6DX47_9HEMI
MSGAQTILYFITYFISIFILIVGQVPPGVNPNHYQQQQYQQPPVQQQYQQQPYQQPPPPPPPAQQQQFQSPPPQQGHGHGHHHVGEPQLLNTANIGQEREHIQEHLEVPIDTSKMTEKELHYHYFTMHDADKNNKLDGCELIKSLIHWHGDSNKISLADENLEQMIDQTLVAYDLDFDGYISYPEYLRQIQPHKQPEVGEMTN